jgi:hypothetical protein
MIASLATIIIFVPIRNGRDGVGWRTEARVGVGITSRTPRGLRFTWLRVISGGGYKVRGGATGGGSVERVTKLFVLQL